MSKIKTGTRIGGPSQRFIVLSLLSWLGGRNAPADQLRPLARVR
jgi:hypothetical protein